MTNSEINRTVAERVCAKCKRSLPLEMFSKARQAKDGLNWSCKECIRKVSQIYLASQNGKETRRRYFENNKEIVLTKARQRRAKYAKSYSERIWCRQLLGQAVKKGYIPRPGEKRTWNTKYDFHHPDYSRPYYGCWVTISDHRKIEQGLMEPPPFIDWEPIVKANLLSDWGLTALEAVKEGRDGIT